MGVVQVLVGDRAYRVIPTFALKCVKGPFAHGISFFGNEPRIYEHHALVHDFKVRRHAIEIAQELVINQTVNLILATNFNHERFLGPFKMLCCHN